MSERVEKIYSCSKKGYQESLVKAIALLGVMFLYLNIISRWEVPGGVYLCFIVIITPFLFFGSTAGRINRIEIDNTSIRFIPMYNPKEPMLYRWKDIELCVIGNVEINDTRMPYNVFGIQLFYLYENGRSSTLIFESYPLKHIGNYEDLLNDVRDICDEYNIHCKETN